MISAVRGAPGSVFRPGVGRSLRWGGTFLLFSTKKPGMSPAISVARLAGAAHRRSRCYAVFMKRTTKRDEGRRPRIPRLQLRPRRLPRPEARGRGGRGVRLAQAILSRRFRSRRHPRGFHLRRLPPHGGDGEALSRHGGGAPVRGRRGAGHRDLQRLPDPPRGGSSPGGDDHERLPPVRLRLRPPARRHGSHTVHAGDPRGDDPQDPRGALPGELLRGRADLVLPRGAGPGGLSLLRPGRERDEGVQPERLRAEHRRDLQRERKRPRHDAPPGTVRGRGAGQRRRPPPVRCDGRLARGEAGMKEKPVTPALAREHGLSAGEYGTVLGILGRTPSLTELGIFSVMWSEHCSYKSSRIHLKKFPTKGPRVLQGPGENAGIVDIGDGLAVAFKMESHNHPSFIEPYQGAATGVGGILRDIFTMGARPIASLNSLRFGSLSAPRMRHLVDGVVRGIAGYGNCMGIPTVGGETTFHPGYNGNILVNVMNVGVVERDRIFRGRAEGSGNPVIYLGSKTGRDGIHGATMASEEFAGDETRQKRPTVQVGDPFTEKLLMEACLELFRTDAVVGIQDMGAAGLTSSSFEMAGRAGTGLEIDLSKVPVREPGMTPYEILLSESQERMLLVARTDRLETALRVFRKREHEAVEIGRVTDSGRVVAFFEGRIVVDLPAAPLSERAPIYDRPRAPATPVLSRGWEDLPEPASSGACLRKILATENVAQKSW